MRARDVMTSPVVAVTSDTTVKEAACLLSGYGFTALPVLDDDDRLVGIVTEADLVRDRFPRDARYRRFGAHREPEPGASVGAVMTSPAIGMSAESDVTDLVAAMWDDRVRSMPIVAGSRVVGIVTRRDLVRVLARDDREIAGDVRRTLANYAGPDRWTVRVRDGVVEIQDNRDDSTDRHVAMVLAEGVRGVTRGPRHRRTTVHTGAVVSGNIIGRGVVAAVDGSESARHAARWAAVEADRRGLPLRLVNVVGIIPVTYPGAWLAGREYLDELVKLGRDMVAEVRAEILAAHPDLAVDADVVVADLVSALVAESENATLMVLGSRGLGGFTGMLVGSTAIELVSHGRGLVAVIRGRKPDDVPPETGPVVVGVDGSPASEAAVALAFEEASLRRAELIAVHTWTEYASDYTFARKFMVDWAAIETKQHEMLAERLAGWQEPYPDVVVRRKVVRDHPVSALLEWSGDAQLVVVGSRGHGGFTGMLLGSTSRALIYHTSCPLLVARPAE